MKWLIVLLTTFALGAHAAEQINKDSKKETGSEKGSSTRVSKEEKNSKSSSRTVNMNAALLRAYVDIFEVAPSQETVRALDDADSTKMLGTCLENIKIISSPLQSFPSYCPMGPNPVCFWDKALGDWSSTPASSTGSPRFYMPFQRGKPTITSCYLLSATFAHSVLTLAAENLEEGVQVGSVENLAREAIAAVDLSKALEMAFRIGSTSTCLSSLQRVARNGQGAVPFTWDCGQVVIDAQARQYKISGRPTLSEEAINGRRIDVVVSNMAATTNASEQSTRKYSKGSTGTSASWAEQVHQKEK